MADFSPPVRAVLMTAEALGITLQCKEIDLSKGEQFDPNYLKVIFRFPSFNFSNIQTLANKIF